VRIKFDIYVFIVLVAKYGFSLNKVNEAIQTVVQLITGKILAHQPSFGIRFRV
jgi:hypothetical protein